MPLLVTAGIATPRRRSSDGRRLIRLMGGSASSFLQGQPQRHGQNRLHHPQLLVRHV
jgi:hypothetical protein